MKWANNSNIRLRAPIPIKSGNNSPNHRCNLSQLDPWFYAVAHEECRKWTYEKDYNTQTQITFRNSSWLHSKVDLNKLARSEREAVIIDPAFMHWSPSGNCSFRRFLFECCHHFFAPKSRQTQLCLRVFEFVSVRVADDWFFWFFSGVELAFDFPRSQSRLLYVITVNL